MRFYFHPDAEEEFDDAAKYYEECQEGLRVESAEEVHAAIARIIGYPDARSRMSANPRHPYGGSAVPATLTLASGFPHASIQV